MIKEIIQAVASLEGIEYVMLLDKNGDTHFSDSLIVEEGKEMMEVFLHFLAFANKLRMAGDMQFEGGDWVFNDFTISIFIINENTLILSRKKKFNTLKLTKIVSQIFDEIKQD